MIRRFFYKFNRSFKNLKNVIFHVKRLSPNLTLSIENVDKEYWKCKGESNRWGHITDGHRNAITLSAMER